jgi:dihydrofolate synthase / folylpolyglutamate synthase
MTRLSLVATTSFASTTAGFAGSLRNMPNHRPDARRRDDDLARVLDWLDRRTNFERVPVPAGTTPPFGLAGVRRLLARLGNPQLRYPVAHVAGTKGKGSTVAMLAAILQDSGHRVGRYLSPHVHSITERISIDGIPIGPSEMVAAFEELMPVVDALDLAAAARRRHGPTWFEVMTAAAFVHFARAKVDVAVLETGLGGRLDATNVSRPTVTVITSISRDHTRLLGSTLAKIAGEKAGIIKRGCPIISGVMQPSARRVITATAGRRRAPLRQLGRDFTVHVAPPAADADPLAGPTFDLDVRGRAAPLHGLTVAMPGRHQADNAALAVVAALHLDARGIRVTEAAISSGLARTTLPARTERLGERPLVVVDAAHNVASMRSLLDTLRGVLDRHRPRALVFAASADKEIEKMLATTAGLFETVVVTRYLKNPRAAAIARLEAACTAAGLPRPLTAESPAAALAAARSRVGPRGLVVVAGSFFLAAEVGLRGASGGIAKHAQGPREDGIDLGRKAGRQRTHRG